jgi:hypothetical protein
VVSAELESVEMDAGSIVRSQLTAAEVASMTINTN